MRSAPLRQVRASSVHPRGHLSPESSRHPLATLPGRHEQPPTLALQTPALPSVPRMPAPPHPQPLRPRHGPPPSAHRVPHSTPSLPSEPATLLPPPRPPPADTARTLPSRTLPAPEGPSRVSLRRIHHHPLLPLPLAPPCSQHLTAANKTDTVPTPQSPPSQGRRGDRRTGLSTRRVWEGKARAVRRALEPSRSQSDQLLGAHPAEPQFTLGLSMAFQTPTCKCCSHPP